MQRDAAGKPEEDNIVRTAPLPHRIAAIADVLQAPALAGLRGFVIEVVLLRHLQPPPPGTLDLGLILTAFLGGAHARRYRPCVQVLDLGSACRVINAHPV